MVVQLRAFDLVVVVVVAPARRVEKVSPTPEHRLGDEAFALPEIGDRLPPTRDLRRKVFDPRLVNQRRLRHIRIGKDQLAALILGAHHTRVHRWDEGTVR